MNTTVRNYETLYIVDATLTDEQMDSIIEKYSKLITDQGGEVQAAGRWDKRRLAYEVMGRREGAYILMYFSGEPAVSAELDRVFRIADEVLRHIIVRVEPEHIDTKRLEQLQAAPEAAAPSAEESAAEEAAAVEETPAEEPTTEAVEEVVEETTAEPAEESAPAEEPVAVEEPQESGAEEQKAE